MNHICVSCYNINNLDWLKEYSNPITVYDKTWNGGFAGMDDSIPTAPTVLQKNYPQYKIINASVKGYNIHDYLTFIIDNYHSLPDVTVFIKGNIIGRHVTKPYLDSVINNKTFTPIQDWEYLSTQNNMNTNYMMFSCDGSWLETNDSWYMSHFKLPKKYFQTYNDFLKFCFVNPVIPKYIQFPPGGNFIVPKEYIYKYNLNFYKNLRLFIDHSRVSAEAHLIERALYTIWTCNFKTTEKINLPL
jgi:hypothetical protein